MRLALALLLPLLLGACARLPAGEARGTPAEAAAYAATGEPLDKAGGYAVQGRGAVFIRELSGSYSGVMGLPLYETAELLELAGAAPPWRAGP